MLSTTSFIVYFFCTCEYKAHVRSAQELDNKSIQRIEKAVAKSEFSQGKKLKVVTKVCLNYSIENVDSRELLITQFPDQP